MLCGHFKRKRGHTACPHSQPDNDVRVETVPRHGQRPESPRRRALQEQCRDGRRKRQTADDAHAPQNNEMRPPRRQQLGEQDNDAQLGKPERLDAGDVGNHHPFDDILLLLEVERVKVLAVAPLHRHMDKDAG